MTDEPNAVRPKLVVGRAADALTWYADVLGAEVGPVFGHDGTVVFATLDVLGTRLTLKDADGADPAPTPGPILDVVHDDPDALARATLDRGATVVHPMSDRPWGGRWGRVRDPFGVQWLLATPDDATPEEVRAAMGG
ncbi:VOC family protein [Nocardioides litoris]|uniref:VOC family protein n=1 Tax=Nocardioides litoris TaxID=1926648 RepID=UPI001476D35D|nr:VOC family protein [Nocardioides litoris]